MLPSLVTWQMSRKRPSLLVTEARKKARNEKRKKQRLVRKAASLTPEHFKRIAILKKMRAVAAVSRRCGGAHCWRGDRRSFRVRLLQSGGNQ